MKNEEKIRFGIQALDEKFAGISSGDLVILGSRPGVGKTSLAMTIAVRNALGMTGDGVAHPVACHSLELPEDVLAERYMKGLEDAPIFVDDTAGADVDYICERIRNEKLEHGIGLVIVDYLHLISARNKAGCTRREEEAYIISRLGDVAKAENVVIILLTQLSRANDGSGVGSIDWRYQLKVRQFEASAIEKNVGRVFLLLQTEEKGERRITEYELTGAEKDSVCIYFDSATGRFGEQQSVPVGAES